MCCAASCSSRYSDSQQETQTEKRQGVNAPDSDNKAVAGGQRSPSRLRILLGLSCLVGLVVLMIVGLTQPDHHDHLAEQAVTDGPDMDAARQDPKRLLEHILGRLYLAFGENDEGALYDALATVASGPLLDDLYLQKRAALTQGPGAASGQQLHGLELLQVAGAERDGGFDFDAKWQVIGAIEHGDHVHVRGNAYSARLRVEPEGSAWRLVAFDLLDIERQDPIALEHDQGHDG